MRITRIVFIGATEAALYDLTGILQRQLGANPHDASNRARRHRGCDIAAGATDPCGDGTAGNAGNGDDEDNTAVSQSEKDAQDEEEMEALVAHFNRANGYAASDAKSKRKGGRDGDRDGGGAASLPMNDAQPMQQAYSLAYALRVALNHSAGSASDGRWNSLLGEHPLPLPRALDAAVAIKALLRTPSSPSSPKPKAKNTKKNTPNRAATPADDDSLGADMDGVGLDDDDDDMADTGDAAPLRAKAAKHKSAGGEAGESGRKRRRKKMTARRE